MHTPVRWQLGWSDQGVPQKDFLHIRWTRSSFTRSRLPLGSPIRGTQGILTGGSPCTITTRRDNNSNISNNKNSHKSSSGRSNSSSSSSSGSSSSNNTNGRHYTHKLVSSLSIVLPAAMNGNKRRHPMASRGIRRIALCGMVTAPLLLSSLPLFLFHSKAIYDTWLYH